MTTGAASRTPRQAKHPCNREATIGESGKGAYVEEVFEGHLKFWAFVAFAAIWLWAGLEMEGSLMTRAIAGVIVAGILFFVGMISLVLPLALAPLALFSAWFFAHGMHPAERARAIEALRQERQRQAEIAARARAMAPPAQRHNGLLLALLALWAGWRIGKDDEA